jgi:hypothetical protein
MTVKEIRPSVYWVFWKSPYEKLPKVGFGVRDGHHFCVRWDGKSRCMCMSALCRYASDTACADAAKPYDGGLVQYTIRGRLAVGNWIVNSNRTRLQREQLLRMSYDDESSLDPDDLPFQPARTTSSNPMLAYINAKKSLESDQD